MNEDVKNLFNANNFKDFKGGKLYSFVKKYAVLLLAIIIILLIADFAWKAYFEYIELKELGGNFESIFVTNIAYSVTFSLLVFLFSFVIYIVTFNMANRGVKEILKDNGVIAIGKSKMKFPIIIAALLAIFLNNGIAESLYKQFMLLVNSTKFNIATPVTNYDVGYYIFNRPFFESISGWLILFFITVIVVTAIYYLFKIQTEKVEMTKGVFSILKNRYLLVHFSILVSLLVLSIAFKMYFAYDGIVYSSFYNVTGAGYVTANILKYLYIAAPYLLCVSVFFAIFSLLRGRYKYAIGFAVSLPVIAVVTFIVSLVFQQFVVRPNEPNYEKEYLKYNMSMTREGFNLNNIKTTEITDKTQLTKKDIEENVGTIENLRIVDYKAALRTNKQLESNTYFYTFVNGDIVSYNLAGKKTPVFVSAREINVDKLPGSNSYVNKMFKYTHGYGIVVNPINQLSEKGQIESVISGLRMQPKEEKYDLKITEPRIYFGENTTNDVIVNPESSNKEKEIDMDGSVTTSYNGTGGIKLNGLNKILYAIKNADINFLLSSNIDSNSKLLTNREIISRVKLALPFLTIDKDAYIVVSDDGSLKWVIDGYTSSDKMPYAESVDGVNYIRNSVKILVDAYDGTVSAYIVDKNDPIINTYSKIYPSVFAKGDLPKELASSMRYPETLFEKQTQILNRYHLDPEVDGDVSKFYENQDRWEIAKFTGGTASNDNSNEIEPYYNMVKLPGNVSESEEMVLMRPFTPSSTANKRNNMVAWCAVRNSYENYGELILYKYPRNTNLFGPEQLEVNINQIAEVSSDMTLWGQGGSEVYKGNLLTIPINNSVLYIEPIYIQAETESSIPQVVKVVVGYQKGNDFIYSYKPTVKEALEDLFDGKVSSSQSNVTDGEGDNEAAQPQTTQPNVETTPSPSGADEYKELEEKINELDKQIDDIKAILEKMK